MAEKTKKSAKKAPSAKTMEDKEPKAEKEVEIKEEVKVSPDEKYAWVRPGIVVKIHQKIKELNPKGEEKERIQVFEGIVIARRKNKGIDSMITVRKESDGVGVERIFPLHMPSIANIEPVRKFKTTRAKLYYLKGYKKKLKEDKSFKV